MGELSSEQSRIVLAEKEKRSLGIRGLVREKKKERDGGELQKRKYKLDTLVLTQHYSPTFHKQDT